jgi:hypothetical protein
MPITTREGTAGGMHELEDHARARCVGQRRWRL